MSKLDKLLRGALALSLSLEMINRNRALICAHRQHYEKRVLRALKNACSLGVP